MWVIIVKSIKLVDLKQVNNKLVYTLDFDFEDEDSLEIMFFVAGKIVDTDMFVVKKGITKRSLDIFIQEDWISMKVSICYNLNNGLILMGSKVINDFRISSELSYKVEIFNEKELKVKFRNELKDFIFKGEEK